MTNTLRGRLLAPSLSPLLNHPTTFPILGGPSPELLVQKTRLGHIPLPFLLDPSNMNCPSQILKIWVRVYSLIGHLIENLVVGHCRELGGSPDCPAALPDHLQRLDHPLVSDRLVPLPPAPLGSSRSQSLQNEGWTLFMAIVHWRQRGIHVERLQPLAAESFGSTSPMLPRSTGATLANMSLLLTTGSSPPARAL